MFVSRIRIKNWRNFKEAEAADLIQTVYILGPNAAGKSNLLDALRFLRDVGKSKGGGLQEAIHQRGGVSKLRCLHARNDTEVLIEIDISNTDLTKAWTYTLGFNIPASGIREPQVTREAVLKYGNTGQPQNLLDRPNTEDKSDPYRLRQTHIEQINTNEQFRDLARFLGDITYVHLVPQLLKFGDQIGGSTIENDPFGQEFMVRISRTPEKTRIARLKRIESGLQTIVPHLQDLKFVKDDDTGRPHLEIKFKHHRPHGARQREDQFSDGTLRLISILWLVQESGDSPILLEEPELSLNEEIVRALPLIFSRVSRKLRTARQIVITTHSNSLLSNEGIDRRGIVIITPSADGSTIGKTTESENIALSSGFSPAEVVLPRARKVGDVEQLVFEI